MRKRMTDSDVSITCDTRDCPVEAKADKVTLSPAPAHTKEENHVVSFCDIFEGEQDAVSCSSSEAVIQHTGECGDVVSPGPKMSSRPHAPKKLSFSDRVAHEARKLKQRFMKAQIENPGHVTVPTRGVRGFGTVDSSVTDAVLTPIAHWPGAAAETHRFKEIGSKSVLRLTSVNGSIPPIMQPDSQVMEWFRNRFDSIDIKYRGRAETINELSRRVVYVEQVTENTDRNEDHVDEEMEELKDQIEKLKSKLQADNELKERLAEAIANADELESKLAIERKHNEESLKDKMVLQQRISNYSTEIKNLNESMDVLKNMRASETEEHERHKAELMAKIAQLQKDITHFNDNLFSCYKVIESQKTEITYLRKQNEALKDEAKRLKLDIRRLYETNSSLKSQNLSLIEINNRIRTKTLFKTDTTDTCSTRGSCTSKMSCFSREEFPFFLGFNETSSVHLGSEHGDPRQAQEAQPLLEQQRDESNCSGTSRTVNIISKRETIENEHRDSLYGAPKSIADRLEFPLPAISENNLNAHVKLDRETPVLGGNFFSQACNGAVNYYTKGDGSAKETYIVDNSTVCSVDNTITNYVEALSVRDLSTDSTVEATHGLGNKSWLLEKVSRISNRDSLDYLKAKIKLITTQECRNPEFL